MRIEDIAFAIKLTDQEKWGLTRGDLERILRLDQRGSFIAHDGSRRVGLTTTTTYGRKLAWIGNVIVDKSLRGKRIGRSLVQHAVRYLKKSRLQHIALYCFNENVEFYQNLGFVKDAPFVRLRRKARLFNYEEPRPGSKQQIPLNQALSADKKAFGADRSRLIRLVLAKRKGWYLGSGTQTSTCYLLVKEYHDMYELGPWVCIRPPRDQPTQLLRKALGETGAKPIEASCLRNNRRVLALFTRHGFRAIREGYRMYLDKTPHIGKPEANYALGFLDKG